QTPWRRAFLRSAWDIGSWRELRAWVKKQRSDRAIDARVSANRVVASHRCALVVATVVARSWHERLLASRALADIGCARATGFPPQLGTPLAFTRTLGGRRCAFDLARHWPGAELGF